MVGNIVHGLFGLVFLIGISYLMSSHKKHIDWKLVGNGLLLQFILALSILKIDFVYEIFRWISDRFVDLINFSEAGATFLFGKWPQNAEILERVQDANGGEISRPFSVGYIFAFKVLPTVIFFSALTALLYYLGILQKIIYAMAFLLRKFMKISGSEALAAAANVFVGQTEAPLVIKPYLSTMTRSQIACVMVGGFATIAGAVFALFVGLLGNEFAIHFLTASIISAPAAIIIAKIIEPETNKEAFKEMKIPDEKLGENLLDSIALGTVDGLRLAVNVGAMLLVIISLVALLNGILGAFGGWVGLNELILDSSNGAYSSLSIEYVLGLLFSPIAFAIGVPWQDSMFVGQLLGKKMALNEVIAYIDLHSMISEDSTVHLSRKSILIATYALCGFANFSSIGIQIGGISALAPNQRPTLTQLGFKTMIGGTIAALMTGAIAGMLLT